MLRDQIQQRWSEIVTAMMVAGIPRDELSILAIVAGAHHLSERLTPGREMRPIGFSPAERREGR